MVDIQQRALGAFEEQLLAAFHRVEQVGRRVADQWLEPAGVFDVLSRDRRRVEVVDDPAAQTGQAASSSAR